MKFQLFSRAFAHNSHIPACYSYTDQGNNISPPLHWEHPPESTKSYALIVDDQIMFNFIFVHWVVYNIPVEVHEIEQGASDQQLRMYNIQQGLNGYQEQKYVGPHPVGGAHAYRFTMYALDSFVEPDAKMNKDILLSVIDRHILAETQLVGCYP
jgi:Raf kinase inhibitor-like YbhB/YbcL family protein